MKKAVALLLVLVMLLSFTACKAAEETGGNDQDTIVIVDMLGREVNVPADTQSSTVASSYGVATPFLATLGIIKNKQLII